MSQSPRPSAAMREPGPAHHPDFLGTASQDSPYLQDTLTLGSPFDPYTLPDIGVPFLSTDATVHNTDAHSSWATSSPYPTESVLFGNNAYLSDTTLPSPSPSLPNLGLHDSYWSHHDPSPNYGMHVPVRNVPRITVETELLTTPARTSISTPYDQSQSPFHHSPTAGYSPSSMIATPSYHNSSPSSIGSAPPVTPETPYHTISPNASPFINRPSVSPVSPYVTGHGGLYEQEQPKTIVPGIHEQSVLDIAHAVGHPLGGALVPQKTYRPHTLSDRRRYVEEVQLEEPIMFYTNNPAGCGILLKDAFASKFSTLEGRDDAMFVGRGPSVSIRLNWPGYAPWSRQIPTRDFRSPPHPITRAKLARNVAKTIQRFVQEMEDQAQEDVSEAKWRVGSRGIQLNDLVLVGLQHVSMGSWQAHVRLLPRRR